jgi:hypothetical protein
MKFPGKQHTKLPDRRRSRALTLRNSIKALKNNYHLKMIRKIIKKSLPAHIVVSIFIIVEYFFFKFPPNIPDSIKLFIFILIFLVLLWWIVSLGARKQFMSALFSLLLFTCLFFIVRFLPKKDIIMITLDPPNPNLYFKAWVPRSIEPFKTDTIQLAIYSKGDSAFLDSVKTMRVQSFSDSNNLLVSMESFKRINDENSKGNCWSNLLYLNHPLKNNITLFNARLTCLRNNWEKDTISLFAELMYKSTHSSDSVWETVASKKFTLSKCFPISRTIQKWTPYIALLTSILTIIWMIIDRIMIRTKRN